MIICADMVVEYISFDSVETKDLVKMLYRNLFANNGRTQDDSNVLCKAKSSNI